MKKAELTTQQIVTIIILIISFAVILFFIFRMNFGEIEKKEICHNSVLAKAFLGGILIVKQLMFAFQEEMTARVFLMTQK